MAQPAATQSGDGAPPKTPSAGRARFRWFDLVWIVAPASIIACHTLQNNDLPMHLAIGEWILTVGSIPDSDPFSGNAPDGSWVAHEWLAGVLFTLTERSFGAVGLILLAMALSGLVALLHRGVSAHLGVTMEAHLWASIPLWIMVGRRLMLRPHLIALGLFFGVWWILLRGRKQPAWLWLLPLGTAFWANVHGSFLIGFAIVGADLLLSSRSHAMSLRSRLVVLALSGLGLVCTPHGVDGLWFPFRLTGDAVFMSQVAEWAPPFGSTISSELFRKTPAFALSCVWLLMLLPCLSRSRNLPATYGMFLAGSLLLYLRHQRYLALFALASHAYLAIGATSLLAPRGSSLGKRTLFWSPRLAVALTCLFLVYPGYPATWTQFRRAPQGTGYYSWGSNLPVWEVEMLAQHDYQGLVLCEYDYGGVVAWKGQGRLKPSMDSRNTVYGASRFQEHQAQLARGDSPLLSRAVAVLIRSPFLGQPRSRLHRNLEDHPAWALFSFSPQSYLYVRAGAGGLDPSVFRFLLPATGRILKPKKGYESMLEQELQRATQLGWNPSAEQRAQLKEWGIR